MSLTNLLLLVLAAMVALSILSYAGLGKPLMVAVVGNSMYPTLLPLDIVFVNPVPTIINEGDIIVFKKGDALIIHRVIKVTKEGYITKGDANPAPDPWIVKKSEVLAKVIQVDKHPAKVNLLPTAAFFIGLDLMRRKKK